MAFLEYDVDAVLHNISTPNNTHISNSGDCNKEIQVDYTLVS